MKDWAAELKSRVDAMEKSRREIDNAVKQIADELVESGVQTGVDAEDENGQRIWIVNVQGLEVKMEKQEIQEKQHAFRPNYDDYGNQIGVTDKKRTVKEAIIDILLEKIKF